MTSASLARVAFELLPTGGSGLRFPQSGSKQNAWGGVTGECPKRESAGEFPGHGDWGEDAA